MWPDCPLTDPPLQISEWTVRPHGGQISLSPPVRGYMNTPISILDYFTSNINIKIWGGPLKFLQFFALKKSPLCPENHACSKQNPFPLGRISGIIRFQQDTVLHPAPAFQEDGSKKQSPSKVFWKDFHHFVNVTLLDSLWLVLKMKQVISNVCHNFESVPGVY